MGQHEEETADSRIDCQFSISKLRSCSRRQGCRSFLSAIASIC